MKNTGVLAPVNQRNITRSLFFTCITEVEMLKQIHTSSFELHITRNSCGSRISHWGALTLLGAPASDAGTFQWKFK